MTQSCDHLWSHAGRGYIPSLDGLRAVSILLVILGHAGLSDKIPGGFGVTIFFFLSGYLITLLLCREWARYGGISFTAFYQRRVVRLGPPLALTILLSLGLCLASLVPGDLSIAALMSQIFFVYNYFTLHVSPATSVEGLGILWSLSVEEQFYLVWPLLFLAIGRGRITTRHLTWALLVILLWRALRHYGLGHSEWMIYISSDTRFDSLLYGCLLALVMSRGPLPEWVDRPRTMYVALIGAFAVIILTFLIRDPGFRSTLRYSALGLALLPVFYYAVRRPDHLIFQPLNWAIMRRIGIYSYTSYLVHYVFMHMLETLGLRHGDPLAYIPAVMILSFGWAALVHEVAEKPLKPLRARLIGHTAPTPS